MESVKEPNKELKEEVDKIFAGLFKEIGSNRQQLANKVLGLHMEINKELMKSKVDAPRKKEILLEVSKIVKMAAQQLPAMKRSVPPPAPLVAPAKPPSPAAKPTPPAAKVPASSVKPKAPAAKTTAKKKK